MSLTLTLPARSAPPSLSHREGEGAHRASDGKGEGDNEGDEAMPPEPARTRAVFSTEDFALLKEAVADYVRKLSDDPRSAKFSNLYHRLGRLG